MYKRLFLLMLLTALLFPCHGKTITTIQDGSGDYQTIQQGVDNLRAGDTLIVYPGFYKERVKVNFSGSEGNPIVIMSLQDTAAVLDGTGFSMSEWGNGLFTVSFKNYVHIIGFKVQNSVANGIFFNNCEHIRVSRCKSYNTVSSGIGIWYSQHVLVDSNEVVLACNDGAQECLTVAGCDSFEIAYNHVHHGGPGSRGGEGIDAKHGTYGWVHHNHVHHTERLGIYVDAWNVDMHHIYVYSNVVHHCSASGFVVANENGGLVRDVYVYNNLSYMNYHFGFALAGYGNEGASHAGKNIHFYHNTAYKNATTGWGGGLNLSSVESDSIYVVDNILSENQMRQFNISAGQSPKNVFVNNNLMYGPNDPDSYGTNAITEDPLFASAPELDFSLRKGSPAIDAASNSYNLSTDFFGKERRGAGADLGAIESPLLTVSACEHYTSPGGMLLTESGWYYDTIDDGQGGDSILPINLRIYAPTASYLYDVNCGEYISPSGKIWEEAGIYMDTISNAGGCDSVMTIELRAAEPSASTITASVCGSYLSPGGVTVTHSGTFKETIENAAGCDSVITIELSVHESSRSSLKFLFCGEFISASGKSWTEGGFYSDTIANVYGCDSVIFYNLSVITLDTSVSIEGDHLRAELDNVAYRWLNCSDNYAVFNDSVSRTFTPSESGTYAVEVSRDACVDTSMCHTFTLLDIAGDQRPYGYQIYPNPSEGRISLNLGNNHSETTVRIRNSQGVLLKEMVLKNRNTIELDISEYKAGLYFIDLKSADEDPVTFKLVRI